MRTAIPGITKTCSAKKRESVAPAMIGPPSMRLHGHGPTTGTRLTMDAPMPNPQYASWSNRITWPEKPMPSVTRRRKTPIIHVNSRGNLYAPKRKTCAIWISTMAIMKFEPQPCRARMNHPRAIVVIESLQTVPRLARGGYVDQRQKNSCNNLQQEDSQRGAAENIKPTCGVARDADAPPSRGSMSPTFRR